MIPLETTSLIKLFIIIILYTQNIIITGFEKAHYLQTVQDYSIQKERENEL